jgi:hypothetical protein
MWRTLSPPIFIAAAKQGNFNANRYVFNIVTSSFDQTIDPKPNRKPSKKSRQEGVTNLSPWQPLSRQVHRQKCFPHNRFGDPPISLVDQKSADFVTPN